MTEQNEAEQLPADIQQMSFEQALEELEQIVRRLEAGQGTLDDAIGSYERGAQLKRHCESKLTQARARVDKISFAADGSATAAPAGID